MNGRADLNFELCSWLRALWALASLGSLAYTVGLVPLLASWAEVQAVA